jgi:Cu(I)/Ag(I) efflux system membrane fusion protein
LSKTIRALGALALIGAGFAGGLLLAEGRPDASGLYAKLRAIAFGPATQAAVDDPVLFYRDPMGDPAVSAVPMQDSMEMDYLPVRRSEAKQMLAKLPATAASPDEPPLFYRDPMGGEDISAAPRKDSMGMDYLPVYPSQIAKALPPLPKDEEFAENKGSGPRRILYYRNPMGLPDISPTPKKDPMGMDYIPVYADGNEDPGAVAVSPARVQTLGVRTQSVERRALTRTLRTIGTLAADERRTWIVAPRFEGWIEVLHANETGQTVRKGEPLMEVYSPELLRAQADFLVSVGSNRPGDLQAGRNRLLNLGLSDPQIDMVRASGRILRSLPIPAPATGTVVAKTALSGMMFRPGDSLFTIVDLSKIVVMADVFESDLGALDMNARAAVQVKGYPGETFEGVVDRIYPTLEAATRTGRVRVTIDNPQGRLKPQMLAAVEIAVSATAGKPVLAVPASSVIDGGASKAVLVEVGEGKFKPVSIRTGRRADGFVEVLEGLKGEEKVVTGANFLIDAESNLKAALAAFTEAKPVENPSSPGIDETSASASDAHAGHKP